MDNAKQLSALQHIKYVFSYLCAFFVDRPGARIDWDHCSQSFQECDTLEQEEGQLAKWLFTLVAL